MENLNLIRKIAWIFHKRSGEDWDDLFQEAAYSYLKALQTHTPEKGSITTYAWHVMSSDLDDYLFKLRYKYYGDGLVSYEEAFMYETSDPEFFWEDLTEDAHEIAKLVLKSYKKFACMAPYQAYARVRSMLRTRGWPEAKIERGIEDLEEAFS